MALVVLATARSRALVDVLELARARRQLLFPQFPPRFGGVGGKKAGGGAGDGADSACGGFVEAEAVALVDVLDDLGLGALAGVEGVVTVGGGGGEFELLVFLVFDALGGALA
jgi:hypothetical protein